MLPRLSPRKTRFRLLARLYRTGLITRTVSMKGFTFLDNSPFPSFLGATQCVSYRPPGAKYDAETRGSAKCRQQRFRLAGLEPLAYSRQERLNLPVRTRSAANRITCSHSVHPRAPRNQGDVDRHGAMHAFPLAIAQLASYWERQGARRPNLDERQHTLTGSSAVRASASSMNRA